MRRSAALALAAVLAVGCNNAAPSADPFAPRILPSTRVPPPGTAAGAGGDASYYTAPAPGPLPTPAPAALPAAGGSGIDVPSNGPFRASPPGGGSFKPNQSNTKPSRPPASRVHGRWVDRSVVPASHVADVSSTPHADDEAEEEEDDTAEGESGEAVDETDQSGHGLQPTSARFARTPRSKGGVDIMDLPPVRR